MVPSGRKTAGSFLGSVPAEVEGWEVPFWSVMSRETSVGGCTTADASREWYRAWEKRMVVRSGWEGASQYEDVCPPLCLFPSCLAPHSRLEARGSPGCLHVASESERKERQPRSRRSGAMALSGTREADSIQPSQGGRFLFGRKAALTAATTQNSIPQRNTIIFPGADFLLPPLSL